MFVYDLPALGYEDDAVKLPYLWYSDINLSILPDLLCARPWLSVAAILMTMNAAAIFAKRVTLFPIGLNVRQMPRKD